VKDFELYISEDGVDWGVPVYKGSFIDNKALQSISFNRKEGAFMRFVVLSNHGPNFALASVAELSLTGCLSGSLLSNFTSDVKTIKEGTTVNFTSTSEGNPTSWSWVFEGGTPSTSSDESPSVTYTTSGNYEVSLTVTRDVSGEEESSHNKTVTDYITVDTNIAQPHYQFNNNLLDSSDLGLDLTAFNYPSVTYEDAPNQASANALTTAGEDGYLKTAENFHIIGDADRTVAAWVKSAAPTSKHQGIVSFGANTTASKFSVVINNAGKLRAEVSGSFIVGSTVITGGTWNHIAVTYTSGTVTLYVNGVQEATSSS
jgi:PKD repeat protein